MTACIADVQVFNQDKSDTLNKCTAAQLPPAGLGTSRKVGPPSLPARREGEAVARPRRGRLGAARSREARGRLRDRFTPNAAHARSHGPASPKTAATADQLCDVYRTAFMRAAAVGRQQCALGFCGNGEAGGWSRRLLAA
jgi:hypothetical protein